MLIPLASVGAFIPNPKTPLVADFGLGDDKTISRAVENIVNPLVSAKLLIKSNLSDADASAVVSKSITVSATSAGQITVAGTATPVVAGQIQFELAQSETALLTSAKYYTIGVTDSAGNAYILERGIVSAGVPTPNPNGRHRVGNWNLAATSVEPPSGGSRLLFQELIDDLDQGEVYTFSRKIQGTLPSGYSMGNLVFTVRRAGTDPDGAAIVQKTVTPGALGTDATYPVSVTFTAANTALFVGAMVWDAKATITNGVTTKKYTVAIGTINAAGPLPAVGTQTPPVYTMAIATPTTVTYIPLQLVLTMAAQDTTPIAPSTRTIAWGSSNKAVATVSPTGLVTAVAAGSCDIVATSEQVEVRATVTVQAAVFSVTTTPSPAQVSVGLTTALTTVVKDALNTVLTGRTVTYTSSNPSVASVDPVTGVVTGVALGTANIIVTSELVNATVPTTTVARVASVTLTPNPLSVAAGGTTATTVVLKDASLNVLTGRVVTYDTSDHSKATVDASGVVTGVATGAVTVTATSEGIAGSTAGTVTSGVIASDNYTRANSSSSMGTATTGQAYVNRSGTAGITANTGYFASTTNGDTVTLPVGAPCSSLSVDVATDAIQSHVLNPYLRWVDANNWLCVVFASGVLAVYTNVAGSINARVSTSMSGVSVGASGAQAFTSLTTVVANVVTTKINGTTVGSPYTLTGGEITAFASSQNIGYRLSYTTGLAAGATVDNLVVT